MRTMISQGYFQVCRGKFTCKFDFRIEKAHEIFFNRNLLTDWHYNFNFSIAESQKMIIQMEEFKKPASLYLQYFVRFSIK